MTAERCTHEHPIYGRCQMPAGHDTLTDLHVYDVLTGEWPGRCGATFFGKVRCCGQDGHEGAHHTDDIVVWGGAAQEHIDAVAGKMFGAP